jgi:hypothetical protein
MAELRRVAALPGVGPVRSPEKPRRFVSDNRGGGYWTYQTVEEEAEQDRLAKEQRAAQLAQSLQWHPAIAAQAAAEREAAQLAAWNAAWPDPRASLRSAHEVLREVEATLAKHRDQAGGAAAHVAERAAGVERAQSEVETVRRGQALALRERLAGNGGALLDDADPVEAAAMRDAERVRRLLAVAQAALTDIAVEVGNAESAVGRARQQVEECALAVIEKTRQAVEIEWTAAQQRAADLQTRVVELRVDQRYSSANWKAPLRALLDDPEAII